MYLWLIQELNQWLVYVFIFFIAILGALVRYLYEYKGKFNMIDLIKDIIASAFVAILTYWFCQAIHLTAVYSAILVGVTSHLGTRALILAQKFAMNKFKLNIEVKEKDE